MHITPVVIGILLVYYIGMLRSYTPGVRALNVYAYCTVHTSMYDREKDDPSILSVVREHHLENPNP